MNSFMINSLFLQISRYIINTYTYAQMIIMNFFRNANRLNLEGMDLSLRTELRRVNIMSRKGYYSSRKGKCILKRLGKKFNDCPNINR